MYKLTDGRMCTWIEQNNDGCRKCESNIDKQQKSLGPLLPAHRGRGGWAWRSGFRTVCRSSRSSEMIQRTRGQIPAFSRSHTVGSPVSSAAPLSLLAPNRSAIMDSH